MSEVLDETGVDDDVTPTDDAAAESDAVARADEPEAVAPSAPSIDWDNLPPEAEARLAGLSQQQALTLLEQLGLVSYEQPQAPALEFDALSDNAGEQVLNLIRQELAAQNAPLTEYVQQQRAAETNSVIDGALVEAATVAKLEDADPGVLRALAANFASQPEYARYGATLEGVKATAKAAADWVAARDKAKGDAAVLNYRKQMGEIQDTPAEPSGAGGGLGIEPKAKTYDEIIARHSGV